MLLAAMLPESYRTRFSDSAENLSHSCSVCGRFSMNRKIVRSDVLVMLAVSVLVVLTNIVLAVGIGLGLSCAAFAWESAKRLNIASYTDRDSATKEVVKVYEVDGPLFFAASPFLSEGFNGFAPDQFPVPQDDPPVQPAGYAFSIWGVIYLWLIVGTGFGGEEPP